MNTKRFRVRVPATCANLGPGFDVLGVAISLYLQVDAEVTNACSGLQIIYSGSGEGSVPTSDANLIVQAAIITAKKFNKTLPESLKLIVTNPIPLGRGLGSSGAACVAGVLLASCLCDIPLSEQQTVDCAVTVEGHPDNVTPAIVGGCVACLAMDNGPAGYIRIPVHPSFQLAVVVPNKMKSTAQARAIMPYSYSRATMVFNLQRVSTLIAALSTGDTHLFPACLDDRVHQPYRMQLAAGLPEILALNDNTALIPGFLGTVISGSGPTALAFCTGSFLWNDVVKNSENAQAIGEIICEIFKKSGLSAEVLTPAISKVGATVERLV